MGKGYALDFLTQHIQADYPGCFDGYFVFDADNILSPDYLERMNESFSAGNEIVTSYRNSKNFGDNWISAGYALWFLRESRYLNGARNRLGSSAAVGGTGFLFSQRILDESHGWQFYLLTEDIEFSIHHILRGERIAICEDAVLYDEQPTDFRQSVRQRLRWAKGYIQVFRRYGADLLKGTARGSWSCFDMAMAIMPAFVLTCISILANVTLAAIGLAEGAGLWFAMRSLLECLGSIYLTLLVIGGILFCNRRGLDSNKKLILGFGFFLVWCVLTVIFFADYKALYLSTLHTEYPSYGAAITCLKLVLVLCGLTALIPVAPAPTGRAYADGLARAYQKQNIEQAKTAAAEAQKDLERRVEQLRSSMSPEELEALTRKLKQESAPAAAEESHEKAEEK